MHACTPIAYLGYWNYFVAFTQGEWDPKILGNFTPGTSFKKEWAKILKLYKNTI